MDRMMRVTLDNGVGAAGEVRAALHRGKLEKLNKYIDERVATIVAGGGRDSAERRERRGGADGGGGGSGGGGGDKDGKAAARLRQRGARAGE